MIKKKVILYNIRDGKRGGIREVDMKTPNLQNSLSPLRENQFITQNSAEFSLWTSIVPREYDMI